MEVKGDVQRTGPLGTVQEVGVRDTANGIGDIQILPLMLGWTNGDLKVGGSFAIYAPTAEYEKGALANISKNFWTFEPGINASWLSSKIGLELSAFAALDFIARNDTTDYQSGNVFHLDATVAPGERHLYSHRPQTTRSPSGAVYSCIPPVSFDSVTRPGRSAGFGQRMM